MRRLVQLVKVVVSLTLYGILGPFGYGAFLVASLAPARDEVRRARRFQAAIFRGFRTMHAWLRWVGLIDHDPARIDGRIPSEPCLIVANHPTLTDVTIVMSTVRDVVTLIRETTYDRWWLRPLLRAAGQVSSPLSAAGVAAMNETLARRFSQGFHGLVFPEGQRSFPDGSLREFSRAPFEAARLAGVPIVPLVIDCEPRWLTKSHGIFDPIERPTRITLRVLEPIPSASVTTSRELRDLTRARIGDALQTPALEAA